MKAVGFPILDADDYVEPEMFGEMVRAAEANVSDIIVCSVDQVSPAGEHLGTKFRFREPGNFEDSVFERFCQRQFGTGSLWNKLYSRDLLLRHGAQQFRWRQDINEDTLVNIGCFLDAQAVTTLTSTYYHYVSTPESASQANDPAHNFTAMLRAYALAVDNYADRGERALKGIDTLYRSQFAYPSYYIADPSALYGYNSVFSEVLDVLSAHHPAGAAALISYLGRPEDRRVTSLKKQWRIWRQESVRLLSASRAALLRSQAELFRDATRSMARLRSGKHS